MTEASTIYKLLSADEWRDAQAAGTFRGSAVDLRDGYVHYSTAQQVRETAAKHFAGQTEVWLLAVSTEALVAHLGQTGSAQGLRWEVSRGGALFPHGYGDLPIAAVRRAVPLPWSPEGGFRFPEPLPE